MDYRAVSILQRAVINKTPLIVAWKEIRNAKIEISYIEALKEHTHLTKLFKEATNK